MQLEQQEARLAWRLLVPAGVIILVSAVLPLGWTVWESLYRHDLRMPWLGRPFVGLDNYREALTAPRLLWAAVHTGVFTAASVVVEVVAGLVLALVMASVVRRRELVRAAVLLPWAVPTVVVGLLWRFMFEGQAGVVGAAASRLGLIGEGFAWLAHPRAVWFPLVLADAWKMTPFVALILLAGLQGIDRTLYEAATMDGAGPWQRFTTITLPLLRPALTVAVLFRTLDGLRVFDLVYVLTGGGPGTATEPIALYTFSALLQNLRFGYGSALAMLVFGTTFACAIAYILFLGRTLTAASGR